MRLPVSLSLLLASVLALHGGRHPAMVAPSGDCADTKTCEQLVELKVQDVVAIEELDAHAVVLATPDKELVLPIFVDEGAAMSIAFRLAHQPSPHPLPPDLLDSVLGALGGKLSEVRIEGVEETIIVGSVLITQGQSEYRLRARPADSIALAITHGVKIFATRQVLKDAGLTKADIDAFKRDMPRESPKESPPKSPEPHEKSPNQEVPAAPEEGAKPIRL